MHTKKAFVQQVPFLLPLLLSRYWIEFYTIKKIMCYTVHVLQQ